jgi:hypothetical protein
MTTPTTTPTTLTIAPHGLPTTGHPCGYSDPDRPHGDLTVDSLPNRASDGTPTYLCRACLVGHLEIALQGLRECAEEADSGPGSHGPCYLPALPNYLSDCAWYTQTLAAWPSTP